MLDALFVLMENPWNPETITFCNSMMSFSLPLNCSALVDHRVTETCVRRDPYVCTLVVVVLLFRV